MAFSKSTRDALIKIAQQPKGQLLPIVQQNPDFVIPNPSSNSFLNKNKYKIGFIVGGTVVAAAGVCGYQVWKARCTLNDANEFINSTMQCWE
jgi:hypothetical protein